MIKFSIKYLKLVSIVLTLNLFLTHVCAQEENLQLAIEKIQQDIKTLEKAVYSSNSISGSEIVNDKDCYILESTPNGIKTEYSRHSSWITKDTYLTLKEESFDKNGKLLKNKSIDYQKIKKYNIMKELHVKNVIKLYQIF